jgi:hypothetical protein
METVIKIRLGNTRHAIKEVETELSVVFCNKCYGGDCEKLATILTT